MLGLYAMQAQGTHFSWVQQTLCYNNSYGPIYSFLALLLPLLLLFTALARASAAFCNTYRSSVRTQLRHLLPTVPLVLRQQQQQYNNLVPLQWQVWECKAQQQQHMHKSNSEVLHCTDISQMQL